MSCTVGDTFVDAPGGRLLVRRWDPGVGAKAPLVLLHDSLGSVEQWRDLPEALAEATGREVIAYDRMGFGWSTPRTQRPSLDFIGEEGTVYFPALRAGLGLERFALFGHSVGGAMAIALAATVPGCEGVVTLSAQAFVEDRSLDGIRAAWAAFEDPAQFARLARWHGERAAWVLDAWTGVWLDPAFRDWSLDAVLPQVRCPVLAIHGDQDEYGSAAFPRRIAAGAGGPAETLILEGCGHVPHRERREEVLARMAGFLGRPGIG